MLISLFKASVSTQRLSPIKKPISGASNYLLREDWDEEN